MEASMWKCILSRGKKTEDALGKELFFNDLWLLDSFFGDAVLFSLLPHDDTISADSAGFSADLQLPHQSLCTFPPSFH